MHRRCDFGGGNSYACTSSFDPNFYRATYEDAAHLSELGSEAHYHSVGVAAGRRAHSGPRTLQIVLMTRDEWPLLESWVLYHANLVGGHNLYIIDGSSREEVRAFLFKVRDRLGVRVITSPAGLGGLERELNRVFRIIQPMSDFVIKLDTDEFLTLREEDVFTTEGVLAHLDGLPVDGRKYKATFTMNALPDASCAPGSSAPLRTTRFSPASQWRKDDGSGMKTLFLAATYHFVDLGADAGDVAPPFDNARVFDTGLLILHYHNQCFEELYENNLRALISHGYISRGDTPQQQLAKCSELLKGGGFPSVHKVGAHASFLTNGFEASKVAYYASQETQPAVHSVVMKQLLGALSTQAA